MAIITSKNGISIRLTEERWKHIVLLHPNLADKQTQVLDAVKDPDYIFRGKADELLAVSKLSARVYLVVVYKEVKRMVLSLPHMTPQMYDGYLKRS